MKGASVLPHALQASFLPDLVTPQNGMMVWWGTDDNVEAARKLGLPEGAPARTPLAMPTDTGMDCTNSPVRFVPLSQASSALAQLRVTKRLSDSLKAWRVAAVLCLAGKTEQLPQLAELMPPSAYAVCRTPETVWPAATLLSAFDEALQHTYLSPHDVSDELIAAQETSYDGNAVHATLRPYQRKGVAWLESVAAHRCGALLADDMGLGKTLQTIALLAERDGDRPHLVVCPTSVLGNWARELHRFAPGLAVVRHHGPDRATTASFAPGSVVITSYSLLLRDSSLLSQLDWDVVVLDEAQQIKNHTSQTAKAARRLPAMNRVALTGTPVENRLSELWSIMDFVNPGILGAPSRFHKRFVQPIESRNDARVANRLRQIIAPYLLRRLKSDVATDLPPKQESIVSCTMTNEQAKLYKTTLQRFLNDGFGSGFERHGRVLKLLTQLKQICNHPAQFLKEPRGETAHRSGKLTRVTEMLSEAICEGHQALVFTQYRAMGDLLSSHFASELGLSEVPFLHGGLGQPARDSLVAEFQSGGSPPPVLIVSLKAGGTGLNLTAATHVIHYDRWWNPAVEDQATDRAHRIGQTQPVDVYKLVTGGTLEERIADLLERKRSLAESIVGTGEDWITNLDDTQLRQLVELSEMEIAE